MSVHSVINGVAVEEGAVEFKSGGRGRRGVFIGGRGEKGEDELIYEFVPCFF